MNVDELSKRLAKIEAETTQVVILLNEQDFDMDAIKSIRYAALPAFDNARTMAEQLQADLDAEAIRLDVIWNPSNLDIHVTSKPETIINQNPYKSLIESGS